MLVSHLQDLLQQQYDLVIPYEVSQFVSHDAELARSLFSQTDTQQIAGSDSSIDVEMLFISQSCDSLEFTLYLDESVLTTVHHNDKIPNSLKTDSVHATSLDNLCALVEGVSHAVCLLWHAHHERQIRPMDLELQAEIDKFLLLVNSQWERDDRKKFHRQLFSEIQYTSAKGSELHERYRRANDSAACYCNWLSENFIEGLDTTGLKHELARFYRLSGAAKFDRIKKLH